MLLDLATAWQFHQERRYADAARCYHTLLEQQPKNAEALHLFGILHHQNGYHARAVELIKQAIHCFRRYVRPVTPTLTQENSLCLASTYFWKLRGWFDDKRGRCLPRKKRSARSRRCRHARFRPTLEVLEDRLVPAVYVVTGLIDGAGVVTTSGHAGTSSDPYLATTLRAAVNAADTAGGNNTITFVSSLYKSSPATATLSIAGDNTAGPSDLAITGSSHITILGPTGNNGITLQNSGNQRLFYISDTVSLTLENLTLTGGTAQGSSGTGGGGGGAGLGGAVYDDGGTFVASGCTFTNNAAAGGNGGKVPGDRAEGSV